MRKFLLRQGKKVALFYSLFILLEFILPMILLYVNIPIIQQLSQSISTYGKIGHNQLVEFLLVLLFYELIWRLRDLVRIFCSIALKKNTMADLVKYILSFKQEFFTKHGSVELTNVVRNISDSSEKLFIIIAKVSRYLSYICFVPMRVFQINKSASIVFIAWILLWLLGSIFLFKYISKEAVKLSNMKNKLLSGISDVLSNIDNVFVYKTYAQEEMNIAQNIARVTKSDKKVQLSFWKLWVAQGICFTILTCLIIFIITESGDLKIGLFIVLYKMITDLVELMWNSSEYIFDFVEHYGKVRNGFNLLSGGKPRGPAKESILDKKSGSIVFRGVKFLQQSKVLCEFEAAIYKDTFVALVGQSGSGKSTFAKLILQIFDPHEGYIINTITNSSFAYSQQYINIFRNTLRYNLTYGINRRVSDHEIDAIMRALKCVFLENMEAKYNTIVDPQKLSVGEIQKISIARAILTDAEVTVFDEPTSALDLESESYVMEAIYKMKKTKIVIAHKVQTIKNADQIIVFDAGKIVARGNYESLYS